MTIIQPVFTFADLRLLSPEIFVLGMNCFVLITSLYSRRWTYWLAQLTLVGAAIISLLNFDQAGTLFNGMYIQDKLALLLKLFVYGITGFIFLYAWQPNSLRKRLPSLLKNHVGERTVVGTHNTQRLLEEKGSGAVQSEYYSLGLFSLLGMMILISSSHFMSFFLGLEILSLPLYAMVALDRQSSLAAEASLKYFVTGSIASGLLLYGFSMIYGVTRSLSFFNIGEKLTSLQGIPDLAFIVGLIFTFGGILFKLGATPFHMWVPDVYQGAETRVTVFLASAPKIVALAIIIRFLAQSLPAFHIEFQTILIVISIASMLLGNLVAIVQTNLKRMLGYSSIAHIGYMLLGLIAADSYGYAAAIFYGLMYTIMAAGGFGILILMSHEGISIENVQDLQGLNLRNPWLAFMMLLVMFSMAGIPPLVGFFAKLGVLEALINTHFIWLAALSLVFAIIGSYYYIAVVKVMYFESPSIETPIALGMSQRVAISINGLSLLLLGLFPSALIGVCRQTMGIISN